LTKRKFQFIVGKK